MLLRIILSRVWCGSEPRATRLQSFCRMTQPARKRPPLKPEAVPEPPAAEPPAAERPASLDRSGESAPPHLGPAEASLAEASPAGLPKIIPFTSLARCGEEVWIETGGQVYRLRKTRQGKLILTK